MHKRIKQIIESTNTWSILQRFENPVQGNRVQMVKVPMVKPEGIEEIIKANWDNQLLAKQKDLAEKGDRLELKAYHLDKTLNALYDKSGKPIMYPGGAVTLQNIRSQNKKIILEVAQTSFPYISALKYPEVAKLYDEQKIEKPRPPLAICTFALTEDGKLTLTVRGDRTNMYPGRKYGQGGNPQSADTNIVNHQIDEMRDEILINPNDFDSNGFLFGGVVIDNEELKNKPDLVGWISVNLTSQQIEKRVKARRVHPNDAMAVSFVPTEKKQLLNYLLNTDTRDFCPPAYAGLVVYGIANYGERWATDII